MATRYADLKRDEAGRKLAEDGITWAIVTLTKPYGAFPIGSVFYGVPSRTQNRGYLANDRACNCDDYQKGGNICAHVRAVRFFEAAEAQRLGLATDVAIEAAFAGVRASHELRQEALARRRESSGSVAVMERPSRTRSYEDLFPDD